MPTDMVLVGASVTAEDVEQYPRVFESLETVVALHHRHHVGRPLAAVLEATELERPQETHGTGCGGVGKLLLDQLERCYRAIELLPITRVSGIPRKRRFGLPLQGVFPSLGYTVLQGAHDSPRDTVPRVVEAREGGSKTASLGQQGVMRNLDILHEYRARDRCSKGELVLDGRCRQTRCILMER